MIKLAAVVVVLIHGLIHLMGFAKAFGYAELPQLRQISRSWGVAWAACAAGISAAAIVWLAGAHWWWMLAAPALIASQVVVVAFWSDAKFGTLANLVLLVAVILGFGSWRFAAANEAALDRLAARAPTSEAEVVTTAELAALPPVVARWLERAGVVGRRRDRVLRLTQRGQMQTSPDSRWLDFRAEQWVVIEDPAFVWIADVRAPLGIPIAGRDRYIGGEGSMRIELLSLIPVADASGPTIDQGALVRFLAEVMWYPSAALEPYVRWEPIDARSARATIRHGHIEAIGTFRFDDSPEVVGFEARRYREDKLEDWLINNDPAAIRELGGVRIPTRSTITWRDGSSEPWTWLRLEVVELDRQADPRRR